VTDIVFVALEGGLYGGALHALEVEIIAAEPTLEGALGRGLGGGRQTEVVRLIVLRAGQDNRALDRVAQGADIARPRVRLQESVSSIRDGLISDFHYQSVRDQIRPTFYQRDQNWFSSLTVRYEGVAGPAVMADLENTWRRLVPEVPFRGEYLDEVLAAQYEDEEALAAMFGAFAALAVLVACLGLYGLAAFTTHNRTKEIGIRKALGASVRDIVRLLVWQFSKPALLASLIAWPIAWYAMTQWLARFQYRIDLHLAIFAAAGGLALLIAWLTVGGHATRMARTNPGHMLRYE
jgi:hypothetical protein